MNALEKVLEEIKDIKSKAPESRNRDYWTGFLCGLSVAEGIIQSHMDETNEDVFEFEFNNVKSFNCQCGRRYVNTCKNGWIPVNERLPEEGEKCIVTDKRGYVHDGITYDYAEDKDDKPSFHKWDDEYWNCFVYDIIAWQPLPEPYKGE